MAENPDAIFYLGVLNGLDLQMCQEDNTLRVNINEQNLWGCTEESMPYKGRLEASIMVMKDGSLVKPEHQTTIHINQDLQRKIAEAVEAGEKSLVLSQEESRQWLTDLHGLCNTINNEMAVDGMIFTQDKKGKVHMPLQCFYPEMNLTESRRLQKTSKASIVLEMLESLSVNDAYLKEDLEGFIKNLTPRRSMGQKTSDLLKLFGLNPSKSLSDTESEPGDCYDYYAPSNGGELQMRHEDEEPVDFFDTPQSGPTWIRAYNLQDYLQKIHAACGQGAETLTLKLESRTLPTLKSLQIYFFTHGYRGYGLLPVRIDKQEIEISLKGIKVEKTQPQEPLPGRHMTSDQGQDGSQNLYRHDIHVATKKQDGSIHWTIENLGDFSIPASTSLNPRVITAATYDDSVGKVAWRREMVQMAKPALATGQGWVICLPGWGKEADMWLSQGVSENRLVLVEREEDLIGHLKRRYPKARVLHGSIESQKTLKRALQWPRHSVDVVSVDPYSGLSSRFFTPLQKVLRGLELSDTAFIGLNFQVRASSRQNLEAVLESTGFTSPIPERDPDLRRMSLEQAWEAILPSTHMRQSFHINQYEGDSASTRMMYAMGIARKI